MNLLGPIPRWFQLGDSTKPVARALLLEQFRILTQQIPVLYAVLIINSISIAYVLPAKLWWGFRFGLPGILIIISLVRLIYWLKLKTVMPSAEEARRQLSKTRFLAGVLNAGFSVWTLALFDSLDINSRAPVSLLVFMGSVGSAYCLGSFPSAARLTLLLTAAPISIRLLVSGDAMLTCIGINLLVLLALLIRMMNTYYRDFVKLVASRAKISAERERAQKAKRTAVEEQEKTKQIAARFDTALNNMSQGLCFFDGAQRLITCNRRYIDMYDLPPGNRAAGNNPEGDRRSSGGSRQLSGDDQGAISRLA